MSKSKAQSIVKCCDDKKKKKKKRKTKKDMITTAISQPKVKKVDKDLTNEFLNKLGTDDLVEFINAQGNQGQSQRPVKPQTTKIKPDENYKEEDLGSSEKRLRLPGEKSKQAKTPPEDESITQLETEELRVFQSRLQSSNLAVRRLKPNLPESWMTAIRTRLARMA